MRSPTLDSETDSHQREEMRVLAVTSHRPEEIERSVSEMAAQTTTLTVSPSRGRLGHIGETYRQTKSAILTAEPDVILLDCFETMGAVVALLARRYDVPFVARLVGDTWTGFGSTTLSDVDTLSDLPRLGVHRLSFHLDSYIFDSADGFVTVSEELAEIATRRTDCESDRVHVVPVPLTVDTLDAGSASVARTAHGIDEEFVVLTVTNLKFREKYEGVKATLAELAPVLRDGSETAFVVAGGGRHETDLRRYVEANYDGAVKENVYLPGYVDSVSDLYALADVFVYVSYRDGYPNAVLEAQTAQLPVVANEAHGMTDQITDGISGFLVDPDSAGQLRSRVETLRSSPDLRRALGTAARKRVLSENTAPAVSERLEDALSSLYRSIER